MNKIMIKRITKTKSSSSVSSSSTNLFDDSSSTNSSNHDVNLKEEDDGIKLTFEEMQIMINGNTDDDFINARSKPLVCPISNNDEIMKGVADTNFETVENDDKFENSKMNDDRRQPDEMNVIQKEESSIPSNNGTSNISSQHAPKQKKKRHLQEIEKEKNGDTNHTKDEHTSKRRRDEEIESDDDIIDYKKRKNRRSNAFLEEDEEENDVSQPEQNRRSNAFLENEEEKNELKPDELCKEVKEITSKTQSSSTPPSPLLNLSEEEEYHSKIIKSSFSSPSLIPKDIHYIHSSIWKNDQETKSTNPFFNNVDWDLLTFKKQKKLSNSDRCNCIPRDDLFSCCLDGSCIFYATYEECRFNCITGEACGNKRITRRQYKDVMVFDAKLKGLGLKTLERIKKHDFIHEYMGLAVCKDKLNKLFQEYKMERMLYIMSLDHKTYLDARRYGSLARYVNHSCDPNCYVMKWRVCGMLRLGIFAKRDIAKDEELTLDYQWDVHQGRTPTKCHCMSDNCRGFLEVPSKELASASRSMQEMELNLSGNWKYHTQNPAGDELVNRTIRIYYEGNHEYFVADVCQYDPKSKKHLVVYKTDTEEVWEDLGKEDWMILEQGEDVASIQKKKMGEVDALFVETKEQVSTSSPTKEYSFGISTTVKEIVSKRVVPKLETNYHVQVAFVQDEKEWKLTVIGIDPTTAYESLKKTCDKIQYSIEQEHARANTQQQPPLIENTENVQVAQNTIPTPQKRKRTRIAFPNSAATTLKSKLGLLKVQYRDTLKSLIVKTKSNYSELVIESALLYEHEKNTPDWLEANCFLYKYVHDLSVQESSYFGFLVGKLSITDVKTALSILSPQDTNMKLEDQFESNPTLLQFTNHHKCKFWISQVYDHIDIYIRKEDGIIAVAKDISNFYFYWNMFLNRISEASNHYPMIQYFPISSRFDDKLFDWIYSQTLIHISYDPFTNTALRLDASKSNISSLYDDDDDNTSNQPLPMIVIQERMEEAKEYIRMQMEFVRQNKIFKESWCFGKTWTSSKETVDVSNACKEMSSILSSLKFEGTVAAHACIILFRYTSFQNQLKRDVQLACMYLAIKCQKSKKWSCLLELLNQAYKLWYPNILKLPSDEAKSWMKRILSAEKTILDTLGYDIFWLGFDIIGAKLVRYKIMALPLVQNIMNLVVSGSILSCGPKLWLDLGPDYIFYVMIGLFSISYLELLFGIPEFNIDAKKLSMAAQMIAESVGKDVPDKNDYKRKSEKKKKQGSVSSSSKEPLVGLRSIIENSIHDVLAFCYRQSVVRDHRQPLQQLPEQIRNVTTSRYVGNEYTIASDQNTIPLSVVVVNNEQRNPTNIINQEIIENKIQEKTAWDNGSLSWKSTSDSSRKKGSSNSCYSKTYYENGNAHPVSIESNKNYQQQEHSLSNIVIKRIIRKIDGNIIKDKVLPILQELYILTKCNLQFEPESDDSFESIRLQGDWRSVGLAEALLLPILSSTTTSLTAAAMSILSSSLDNSGNHHPNSSTKSTVTFVSSPSMSSPASSLTTSSSKAHEYVQQQLIEDDIDKDIDKARFIRSNDHHHDNQRNNVVMYTQNFKSSQCTKNHNDLSNWLCCDDVIVQSNNKNLYPCSLSEHHIINNNYTIKLSSLDTFGRWFLLKFGKCRNASICDLFIFRKKCHSQMENFKNLLLSSYPENNVSDSNHKDCDDNSIRFLLAKWPSEKTIARERAKILHDAPCLKHDHEDYLGMSASALQEMQLLYQLHRQLSSPRGHGNFLLPVSILINRTRDSDTSTGQGIDNDYFNNRHLNLISGNFKSTSKENHLSPGSYLIYEPVSMCLQQVISHLRNRNDNTFQRNHQNLPKMLFKTWFYDILCALDYCHTNHIILRTLSADSIYLDHCGVIKFGDFKKALMIPMEERMSFDNDNDDDDEVTMKKKSLISEADVSNPYIAPELLLGLSKYSKQSDIFSLGCVLCHLLLQKPLFAGKDRKSRLSAMFKIIGTPCKENYVVSTKFPSYTEMFNKSNKIYKPGVIKALKYLIKDDDSKKGCVEEVMDILDQMLQLDPKKRISANQALRLFESKCDFDPQVVSQSKECRMEFVREWIHLKHSISSSLSTKEKNKNSSSSISSNYRSSAFTSSSEKRYHENKSSLNEIDELYTF